MGVKQGTRTLALDCLIFVSLHSGPVWVSRAGDGCAGRLSCFCPLVWIWLRGICLHFKPSLRVPVPQVPQGAATDLFKAIAVISSSGILGTQSLGWGGIGHVSLGLRCHLKDAVVSWRVVS